MSLKRWSVLTILVAACLLLPPSTALADPVLGQVDTFEDGTTQNWVVNLLGMGSHPAPPTNVPTGGPAGVDDNYLRLTSVGGGGSGSRLAVLNLAQWTGNYLASGVNAITMDVNNMGATDLSLRLLFENPMGGPPTDAAITALVFLPSGSGWRSVTFLVGPNDLTALSGSVTTVLANTTALRIYHSPAAAFPGPPVEAQLDVDNIRAAAVPEPATMLLLGSGLAAVGAAVRKRSKKGSKS